MLSAVLFRTRRGMVRGVRSITRDRGWGSSLAALLGLVLLCQFLVLGFVGLEAGITLLRERTDLRLEVQENASDPAIQDFLDRVRQQPYVDDVVYITKEQAFERMSKRDPKLIEFLKAFGVDNPFPETIGVRLKHLEDYSLLIDFLKAPESASVVNPNFLTTTTDQEAQVQKLLEATASAKLVVWAGLGLLFIVILFVVTSLLRVSATLKRDELYVEQLMGASQFSILSPFFGEACFLFLLALGFSYVIVAIVLAVLPIAMPAFSISGVFGPWVGAWREIFVSSLPILIFGEVVAVLLLSLIAVSFALKDQLTLMKHPR